VVLLLSSVTAEAIGVQTIMVLEPLVLLFQIEYSLEMGDSSETQSSLGIAMLDCQPSQLNLINAELRKHTRASVTKKIHFLTLNRHKHNLNFVCYVFLFRELASLVFTPFLEKPPLLILPPEILFDICLRLDYQGLLAVTQVQTST